MPRVNQAEVEQEMRITRRGPSPVRRGRRAAADEKSDGEDLEPIAGLGEGDASRRARSHRPIRQYGEGAARRRDHRAGQRGVKRPSAQERSTARYFTTLA